MRRWYSVAQNYLILNSILAAVSGIVVQSLYDHGDRVWLCVGTLALSLFVLDAEKTANARLRRRTERDGILPQHL